MSTSVDEEELWDIAKAMPWDSQQPAQKYLSAARHMLKEAKVYVKEDQPELAFVLYAKVYLILGRLLPETHPEWASISEKTKAQITKDVQKAEAELVGLRDQSNGTAPGKSKRSSIFAFGPADQNADEINRGDSMVKKLFGRGSKGPAPKADRKLDDTGFLYASDIAGDASLKHRLSGTSAMFANTSSALASTLGVGQISRAFSDNNQREQGYVASKPPPGLSQPKKLSRKSDNGSASRTNSLAAVPHQLTKPTLGNAPGPSHSLPFDMRPTLSEGGFPLRSMLVPTSLISSFVSIAHSQTLAGIETCGLLLGTLSQNVFTITTLFIPKQRGAPDTCTTTHEEEQIMFQDKYDLMTLGWIHTHPTQSCFMSSVDLHTHASYQAMLPEAIAVVCSPRYAPNVGIFRLTDPPGLPVILSCTDKTLFHPHPRLPIYTDCDKGHVYLWPSLPLQVYDARKH